MFDWYPHDLPTEEQSSWTGEQFRLLRNGLPNHRGIAFRCFIDCLTEDRADASKRAAGFVREFEDEVGRPSMSPIAHDIAAKFGLLYAGGSLAADWGILPLDQGTVFEAVQLACRRALRALPDPESDLRIGLKRLKDLLLGGSIIELSTGDQKRKGLLRGADGYHFTKDAGRLYVIRSTIFAECLRTEPMVRRVLEWLDEEGLLVHSRARKSGRSIEWAQRQVSWPDGTRTRSIEIFLPKGLDEIDRMLS